MTCTNAFKNNCCRQDELIAELAAVHQEFSNAKITFTTQIEALQKQQQQAILQNEQLQETVSPAGAA